MANPKIECFSQHHPGRKQDSIYKVVSRVYCSMSIVISRTGCEDLPRLTPYEHFHLGCVDVSRLQSDSDCKVMFKNILEVSQVCGAHLLCNDTC